MTKSNWWFSPLILGDKGNDLLPGATTYSTPSSAAIKKASSFSVDMRRVFVNRSLDYKEGWKRLLPAEVLQKISKMTNDLLIVSSFQTGTSPTVQRIHYLRKEQEINEVLGDFTKTLVCSFSDFQDGHITLRTQVFDVDDYDEARNFVKSVSAIAGGVSGSFPVIAPYVAVGGSIATSLTELINQIDAHDVIIDSNLRLVIGQERTGYNLLQTGHWVCFEVPQDDGLVLDSNMGIVQKSTGRPFTDCSYTIYSIKAVEAQEPNWEIDQKVAKLLSELEGKGNSGKAPIEFLRDTMEGYNKFKKIKRYQELERKGADMTPEEKAVFEKLEGDESIRDFVRNES
jgi:hypothetical protein